MSSKNNRNGGKFGGDHTTFIDLAILLVDEANRDPFVTTISAGVIKYESGGKLRVKFVEELGHLYLKIRSRSSVQEVRIYSSNIQETRTRLARFALNNNIGIAFREAAGKRTRTTVTT